MNVDSDDLLSVLDVLDLDEELVDERIQILMLKNDVSAKNLKVLLHLLKYKHLINFKENTECNNETECSFIARRLTTLCKENIDIMCRITTSVLLLQPSLLCSYSEHFIQQLLDDITELLQQNEDTNYLHILFKLKIISSILNAAYEENLKVNLIILAFPLRDLMYIDNEEVRKYFIFHTIPRFVENVTGYNILDKIWNSILLEYTKKEISLSILSALSDYFIPVENGDCKVKYKSFIIEKPVFWDIILFGLQSDNQFTRKSSIYLAKRSIDSCILNKTQLEVKTSDNIRLIYWNKENKSYFKEMWVNYFIIMESLEEKQSNIVLPSLQLFNVISDIGQTWLNPALKLGLSHDNLIVRQKCLHHRMKYNMKTGEDAVILLNSLNNNNIYEENGIKNKLIDFFNNETNFKQLIITFSKINWSPVAQYHVIDIISRIKFNNIFDVISEAEFTENICLILQSPCNNIVIRDWVQYKIITFVCKSCKYLQWMNFLKIINKININCEENKKILTPVKEWLKTLDMLDDERLKLLNYFTNSFVYIDITLLYLNLFKNDSEYFNECLSNKLSRIYEMGTRQYANKLECFDDFVYVMFLFNACKKENKYMYNLTNIALYVQNLLTNEVCIDIDQVKLLSKCCFYLFSSVKDKEVLLQLYKFSSLILNKEGKFAHKLIALTVVKNLTTNEILNSMCKHEMLTMEDLLEISAYTTSKVVNDNENTGRNLNRFYEDSCEILYEMVAIKEIEENKLKPLVGYMEHVVDCGGYGCLKWILRTMNHILPQILDNSKKIDFDVIKFIERSWREVEELKSCSQFLTCIEEFICIITNNALVSNANFNNILLSYSSKIIDFASLSNAPLYFLTKRFLYMPIDSKSGTLIYILCDILLFCPVIRKDQRILDGLVKSILSDFGDGHIYDSCHFYYEIKNLAVSKLLTIEHQEIFDLIISRLTSKISDIFKNKLRYHENSQLHKILCAALQHLLFIFSIRSHTMDLERFAVWCVEIFAKIPHQNDVKFYFEWLITLYLLKNNNLNKDSLERIEFEKVPAISKQMILYYFMQNKCPEGPYEFVLDYLLSHTMGQLFNVRLTAQYLSLQLFNKLKNKLDLSKYNYTMLLLENNFKENCQEKNYIKLQNNFLVNNFDAVYFLKPEFIYGLLPNHFYGSTQDVFDYNYLPTKEDCYEYFVKYNIKDDQLKINSLQNEYFKMDIESGFIYQESPNKLLDIEGMVESTTIQKKYIPWNNMSDIQTYDVTKMKENKSNLILVASLIDKLPNLGGMARTSEVFGVQSYVVDSLRHLQDRQFQGLSVSAERWVNIEEVRPGKPLKDYLLSKKEEGYSIVGAEQTSSSVSLKTFKFPVKTILLLGHEKEGIPCDLLPIMDYCVEIPQRGFVRSLNVHVTAAIFVWEYVRQHLL